MFVNVILLLFPKYVAVLENMRITDFYSTPGKRKRRFIDLCVVDANGNIDVIEIKKPFDGVLHSRGRYRGNSVPTRSFQHDHAGRKVRVPCLQLGRRRRE